MTILLFFGSNAGAQEKVQIVRLAKLVIDSAQLENYKAALKEGIETAVRLEPGVMTLYAVSEKDNPTHITILEIYADSVKSPLAEERRQAAVNSISDTVNMPAVDIRHTVNKISDRGDIIRLVMNIR